MPSSRHDTAVLVMNTQNKTNPVNSQSWIREGRTGGPQSLLAELKDYEMFWERRNDCLQLQMTGELGRLLQIVLILQSHRQHWLNSGYKTNTKI